MFHVLRTYLEERATVTEDELTLIEKAMRPAALASGEFLQRSGDVTQCAAFVTKGCLRKCLIEPNGKEHVTEFAPETWWVTDAHSAGSQTPSRYFIQAIEDSELLLIDMPSHDELVARVPGWAAAYRKGLQKRSIASEQRIALSLSQSAQDRYLAFVEKYPSIVTRVPQWMVASYLGVSPETVSRIRRRLAKKDVTAADPPQAPRAMRKKAP
jgi:CRP-like cAMP-binding protein